jgi:transcriptional regulator with XRE-family HTH domain
MTDKSTIFSSDAELMALLGQRLRALRKDQGLTLQDVSDRAALNRSTIVKAEKGSNPTLATILRLLRTYGQAHRVAEFIPEPDIRPLDLLKRG